MECGFGGEGCRMPIPLFSVCGFGLGLSDLSGLVFGPFGRRLKMSCCGFLILPFCKKLGFVNCRQDIGSRTLDFGLVND